MTLSGKNFTIRSFIHHSTVLSGNPLGDPTERTTWVLVPEEIADREPLPSIWMLAGFMATGSSFLAFSPWQETLVQRLTRLYQAGLMPAVRFILPDVFTAFGGCQYVDSPAIGRYDTYLWSELLPALESVYPATTRGVAGKSSGGFGAWNSVMRHPDLFRGMVSHSGDMAFEWCYLPEMPKLCGTLRHFDSLTEFWQAFHQTPKKPSAWIAAINMLAMAAAYSPDPDRELGLELPVDPQTLAVDPQVWKRWKSWDPLELISAPPNLLTLQKLSLLFFDAGERDEFHLQYGAQQMHRSLMRLGIRHQFELFADNHFQTHYRYDHSLPLLANALTDSPSL